MLYESYIHLCSLIKTMERVWKKIWTATRMTGEGLQCPDCSPKIVVKDSGTYNKYQIQFVFIFLFKTIQIIL